MAEWIRGKDLTIHVKLPTMLSDIGGNRRRRVSMCKIASRRDPRTCRTFRCINLPAFRFEELAEGVAPFRTAEKTRHPTKADARYPFMTYRGMRRGGTRANHLGG